MMMIEAIKTIYGENIYLDGDEIVAQSTNPDRQTVIVKCETPKLAQYFFEYLRHDKNKNK